jgi:hypothetical protein
MVVKSALILAFRRASGKEENQIKNRNADNADGADDRGSLSDPRSSAPSALSVFLLHQSGSLPPGNAQDLFGLGMFGRQRSAQLAQQRLPRQPADLIEIVPE